MILLWLQCSVVPVQSSSISSTFQAQVTYAIPKKTKLELRVTKIPKEYPWISKDLMGEVLNPKEGSIIELELVKGVDLGESYLPEGTKFYAKLTELEIEKSFNRDAEAVLEFFSMQMHQQKIALHNLSVKTKKSNSLASGSKTIAKLGAYSLAGAIAAPLISYQVFGSGLGSFVGHAASLNPHALASSAIVGAVTGLAYATFSAGEQLHLEPGKEIEIKLKNDWMIGFISELKKQNFKALQSKALINKKIACNLDILSVKKTRDFWGDAVLAVKFKYQNYTDEELRHSSFVLKDSMAKVYEPSFKNLATTLFGKLPKQGLLEHYYPIEFSKAIHHLVLELGAKRFAACRARVVLR